MAQTWIRRLCLFFLVAVLAAPLTSVRASETSTCFGLPATTVLTSPGTLTFTSGSDVFIGSNGPDRFLNTSFDNIGGDDYVCAGGGDDYVESEFPITVDGGQGNDTVNGSDGTTANGGSGRDYLLGSLGSELWGGSGSDTISGSGAVIHGDAGSDDLSGGNHSQVYGGSGNDEIFAGSFSVGRGEDGNDRISIGFQASGDGGAGSDRLENVDDANSLDCGSGRDRVISDGLASERVVNCEITLSKRS